MENTDILSITYESNAKEILKDVCIPTFHRVSLAKLA